MAPHLYRCTVGQQRREILRGAGTEEEPGGRSVGCNKEQCIESDPRGRRLNKEFKCCALWLCDRVNCIALVRS